MSQYHPQEKPPSLKIESTHDDDFTPLNDKILHDEDPLDGKMLQDEDQIDDRKMFQEEDIDEIEEEILEQKRPKLEDIDEVKVNIKNAQSLDDHLEVVVKLLENKYKQKLDLYEKLGKSCPSFASFEIAVNENKGAKLLRSNTYHIFNIAELFKAWSENMTYLTKRKKSEKHWQAGLKKWLDGQWRKDKRAFDLVLKEQKIAEANQIRSLISQLFHVKEEIIGVVKAPSVVYHHHHYYCSCKKMEIEQMNNSIETKDGEVHHHHIHYKIEETEQQSPSVPLESQKIKSEPSTPTDECPTDGDKMDYEVINDMTEEIKYVKKKTKKRRIIRGREGNISPLRKKKSFTGQYPQQDQSHTQQQNQSHTQQQNQSHIQQNQSYIQHQNQSHTQLQNQSSSSIDLSSSEQSNNFEWELPQVHWQMPEVQLPQWGNIQVPQVQWPQMPHVQWQIPQVQWPEVNWPFSELPPDIGQWPQNITESVSVMFRKDKH